MESLSDEAIRGALDKIWERSRTAALQSIASLETAAAELSSNALTETQRRAAEQEARRLASAVGVFGFWNASALAREAEILLEGTAPITDAPRLASIAARLREELDDAATVMRAAEAASTPPTARVLVISDDVDFRDRLAADSRSSGIEIIGAESANAAHARLGGPVDAVLLDLTLKGVGVEFLAHLRASHPDLQVIVISDSDTFDDRIQAARLGGRGFLQKPVRPAQVVDLLRDSLMVSGHERPTIVAVDHDSNQLTKIVAELQPLDARVITVSDLLSTWSVLAETSPDLVILNLDTPQLEGLELCQVLRNDPRWAAVPVLCLATNTAPDAVNRMYECGADDVVPKPLIGGELVARVRNRLERTRMLRLAADVDSLTGVATRRRGVEVLERFFKLAHRQRQPISIAAVDLDRFKEVNDRFGHSVGDMVLRRAATILAGCFRGEDVVARWGGEEFVIGMYSMTCAAATARLEQSLAKLRHERFETGRGVVSVTFSAGVAEFPRDGIDWGSLYRVADDALARAKQEGRNRVVTAGSSGSSPSGHVSSRA